MNSIVVYFSHTGNTRSWAEKTASLTGSDITGICAITDFPDDICELESFILDREKRGDKAPVYPPDDSLDGYGVIIAAFPIWACKAPAEICSFFSSVDCRGRKIFVLATCSGAVGDYMTDIKKACEGASFGRSCVIRTGCPDDSVMVRQDAARYEEWILEIKRFLGR